MKTLYLMRHAKSSWDEPTMDDFDRPLNKRGLRSAPVMGRYLRKKNHTPDMIICSPAKRTKETLHLLLESARFNPPVKYEDRIYEAAVHNLMDVISETDDSVNSLMLIGHNPGMSNLLEMLTGMYHDFPTATIASITMPMEHWAMITPNAGSFGWAVSPKELEE